MRIDLHGTKVEDLEKKLDEIMFEATLARIEQIEFITGTGVLQDELIRQCRDLYKCNIRIKLGNTGAIIVEL